MIEVPIYDIRDRKKVAYDDLPVRPFWRTEDPEFDDEGGLTTGGMLPHQRNWWELPNFIRVLLGGYGSGKSYAICKRTISLCLENAPTPCALVSPTYKVARHTTISTIKELLVGKQTLVGAENLRWTWLQGPNEFTIHDRASGTTGKIIIYSGENPENLKGPNLAAAGIDEPFMQDKAVFEQMLARVRVGSAPKKEINLTGTPEGISSWGYDIIEGELAGNYDLGYVRASTRANILLDPNFYERLRNAYDDRTASAYLEGHFVNLTQGLVYYAFNPAHHVIDIPMPEGATLGVGMDFNVNPMAFVVFWTHAGHIHFFKEYELPNSDTEEAIQVLRSDFPGIRDVYPDASGRARKTSAPGGRSDFSYLEDGGFDIHCHRSNPPVRDRYNATNGKLKARDGRVSLTVSTECKKLRRYLMSYNHVEKNKDTQKGLSHLLDAFSYPVAYTFPVAYDHVGEAVLRHRAS